MPSPVSLDRTGGGLPSDYSELLEEYDIEFCKVDPYLVIGGTARQTDCILHVSVAKDQLQELLKEVIKVLKDAECTFQFPESDRVHSMMLDGSLGYQTIGKVLSVYPHDFDSAVTLAKNLISATVNLKGPEIPAAVRLSNCVYLTINDHSTWNLFQALGIASEKNWPYKTANVGDNVKADKWLAKKYFLMHSLKVDAKGNVYKALDLRKWLNVQWCVVKQGKRHQCTDHAGRDIGDRLRWQFKVQSEIADKVAVPKPIDLFEQAGDTYFVMEYIEGKPFNDHISELSKGVIWHKMGNIEKRLTIDLLLQIIDVIEGMHQLGYLHRDLNPVNFLVTPKAKVFAIDLELSYSTRDNLPTPCFTLGTAGYMSPQQKAVNVPTIEDDVFGIASLIVRSLTGVSPTKFELTNGLTFIDKLNYFIRDEPLAKLVAACFDQKPGVRPTLEQIRKALVTTDESLDHTSPSDANFKGKKTSEKFLDEIINKSINALAQYPFVVGDKVWYSNAIVTGETFSNNSKAAQWYPNLYQGVSGVLYTLHMAQDAGYQVNHLSKIAEMQYKSVVQSLKVVNDNPVSGFCHGQAGIIMLAGYKDWYGEIMLVPPPDWDHLVKQLLSPNDQLNLADGICGQGLTLMKIILLLGRTDWDAQVHKIASQVIEAQQKDGSWLIKNELTGKKEVKPSGLMNGISGITYFLLCYGFNHDSTKAKRSCERALKWLLAQRKSTASGVFWPVNSFHQAVDPWFENGFTGIAYLMIHAYERFQMDIYRNAVYEILLQHPRHVSSNYLSQATGLAGLGEVYLEAFDVFRDIEWLDRAEIIVDLFVHLYKETGENGTYWLDGGNELPDPGFMNGQAGIIHFLVRYRFLDNVEFPLLTL